MVPVPGSPVPAPAIPRLRAIADRGVKETGTAPHRMALVTTQQNALTSATPAAGRHDAGTLRLG
jgi:hypothetical protein